MSIYSKIEQEGLTADQTSGLMQQEMKVSAKQRYHRLYGCCPLHGFHVQNL